MFSVALACGNTFILKCSERGPSLPVELVKLITEAALPAGVLDVVHGDKTAIDAIFDNAHIKAASVVGSSDIAQYVYSRGTANGRRVQAMGGGQNHGIVMPDADLEQVVAAAGVIGSGGLALSASVEHGDDRGFDIGALRCQFRFSPSARGRSPLLSDCDIRPFGQTGRHAVSRNRNRSCSNRTRTSRCR